MERRRCDGIVGADKIRCAPETQRHEDVAAPQVAGAGAAFRNAEIVVVQTALLIFCAVRQQTLRFRHTTRVRVECIVKQIPPAAVEAKAAGVGEWRRRVLARSFLSLLGVGQQFLPLRSDRRVAIDLRANFVADGSCVVWKLTSLTDAGDFGDLFTTSCQCRWHDVISGNARDIRRPEVHVQPDTRPPRRIDRFIGVDNRRFAERIAERLYNGGVRHVGVAQWVYCLVKCRTKRSIRGSIRGAWKSLHRADFNKQIADGRTGAHGVESWQRCAVRFLHLNR